MRHERAVGDPVAVMPHWVDARVPADPFLGKDVEGPERPRSDGEARRAMTEHRGSGRVLDRLLRASQVVTEALGAEVVRELMRVAVCRDLMAGAHDLAHERAVTLGDPAEYEE